MFTRARWRLVAAYTAILAVILVGLSFAVFTIFEHGLYSDTDPSLRTDAAAYAASLAADATVIGGSCQLPQKSPPLEQEPLNYTVVDCNGNLVITSSVLRGIYPGGLSQALQGHTGLQTVQRSGHYWRTFSTPVTWGSPRANAPIGAVQLYVPVDGQVHALHRLELVLIGGGLGALVLAGMAGMFLAGRTLAPIRASFDRQRRFIADASHELRTPLTLIRSSAEMVAYSAHRLNPEDAELLDDIVNEVDRMSKLVTDLLTLARVDSSQIRLEKEPVDMVEVVQRVHEDVEPLVAQKQLDYHLVGSGPQLVIGDELRLRQLLLILLDNAIKYTNPGGTVETSVAPEDGHVSVTVQDSGVGIPEEDMGHVFDRFYRADGARTHETGGAGLGLSIADWIVRAHHGKIRISSKPGSGTRITVDLPAALEKRESEN